MAKTGLLELNAVVAVATHRNFRRAAAEVGLSASALSHAISTLERRMGVRLFNRTTRSVSLSAAGERFLARVRPALREISEALESVNEFRNTPIGTLRINTSEGAAQMVLTPLVIAFLKRYPQMKVELITDTGLVDIVAGRFDAGIRLTEAVPRDMISVPCGPPLRFAVVGSPSYFAKHPKPRVPADLAAHDCIRLRFPSGAICKWDFDKHSEELSLDVEGSLTLDNHRLIIEAAVEGVGLAWINEFAVMSDIKAGRLVRVLEDWTPPYPGLSLFYPGHRHVPAALRAFIEVVRANPTLKSHAKRASPPARK